MASEGNHEPNSSGLKSSRFRGDWLKSLEENHTARIKERSLFGHIICSESLPPPPKKIKIKKKILESDIFRSVECEGVTEIIALYKVSPSKFVLVFGSKTAKEKTEGTEIQSQEAKLRYNGVIIT